MPPGRRLTGSRLAAVALGLLAVGTTPGAAAAADDGPAPGEPWFGPVLDWTRDLPADYSERLGRTPSLYGQAVHYPLADDDRTYLSQFAELAATQGAVAVLTLEPQVALDRLTEDHASALVDDLTALHDRLDTHFLVRFAPEMNGSWVTWGQQPEAYVAAFRAVADVVRDSPVADHADMVWSPAYGAGYPFGDAYGAVEPAGRRVAADLDTDGNGTVDDGDDPYGPYFPGADSVDWVGLSLHHFGRAQDFGDNDVPAPGELEARLRERFGYGVRAPRTSFYDRWVGPERPLLLETAALYDTTNDGGAPEERLKRAWWAQVLAAADDHPEIGAISWLEVAREEAEIDGAVADWRATNTPTLARALSEDLDRSAVRLGPVTRVVEPGTRSEDDGRQSDAGATDARLLAIPVGVLVLAGGWFAIRRARPRSRA